MNCEYSFYSSVLNRVAGIGSDEAERLIASAEMSCEEDVYHFDEIERFFLVSCLALW